MSNGPLPSDRCLLSSLRHKQIGDKVRFLGCVSGYSTHSAELTLRHPYPKDTNDVAVLVDLKLLLETLKAEQTNRGQWVHVVGYLTFVDNPVSPATATSLRQSSKPTSTVRISVQALFLWIARDLDIAAYEKSMLDDTNENDVAIRSENRSVVRTRGFPSNSR
ncbi:CST complex subunit Ten1 [Astrocystis sublimbata]|nr:CST complex subunit Ten1 [Astrocystis sublimbata]